MIFFVIFMLTDYTDWFDDDYDIERDTLEVYDNGSLLSDQFND